MKVAGLIVEYNPFHLGHKYHINKTREITSADYVIAVMSGQFTQRGTPAICDKWQRSKMALKGGVDLIIELPLVYSIRSAEFFAQSAARLLDSLNIIDYVVFGSEVGEIKILNRLAELLLENDSYYENRLKSYLKEGFVYPSARNKALLDLIKLRKNDSFWTDYNTFEILKGSNNILGLEYIKALKKYNLNFTLKTIKRVGETYHSDQIKDQYVSATAVRKAVYNKNLESIKKKIPNYSYKILKGEISNNKIPLNKENLGIVILSIIRKSNVEKLKQIQDINEDLALRIKKAAQESGNLTELLNLINTKSYTKTRFQRILLNILFELKKNMVKKHDKNGPSYIRILGFKNRAKKLISKINQNNNIPIIYNPSKFTKEVSFSKDDLFKNSLSLDIYSTDLYCLLYQNPKFRKAGLDFKKKIIKEN